MKVFGIDTTRKKANIFVFDTNTKEKYVLSLDEGIKHSDGLFLYMEKALFVNKLSISDFDCFACVSGPGSFTGIRVGIATIKGLNKVLNKSVISMNMFEILKPTLKKGVILLNSTTTSCYYAKILKGEIVDTGVVNKKEINELAGGEQVVLLREEQEVINLSYNNYKVIDDIKEYYFNCIIDKMNNMQYGELVPYYLQLSQAERNLKDGQNNC